MRFYVSVVSVFLILLLTITISSQTLANKSECIRVAEKNPFSLYKKWYQEAKNNHMANKFAALATVDKHNQPKVRMIHLYYRKPQSFIFYNRFKKNTKVSHLANNSAISLLIFWHKKGIPDHLQIIIEGEAKPLSQRLTTKARDNVPSHIQGYTVVPNSIRFARLQLDKHQVNLVHIIYELKDHQWVGHSYCEKIKPFKQMSKEP